MHLGTHVLHPDYDEESDTLLLYSEKEKPAQSIALGDLIVGYAKDGTVVGLELLNATESIPAVSVISNKAIYDEKNRIKSELLSKITKASVSADTQANFTVISFRLDFAKEHIEGKLGMPITSKNSASV